MTDSPLTWKLAGFGDEIDPDPAVQLAVLQAVGASAVELRGAWGINILDFSNEQVAEFGRQLAGRGMRVASVASPIGKSQIGQPADYELPRLRRAIEIAQQLDSPYIRIFSFYRPDGTPAEAIRDDVLFRLRELAKIAEKHEIVLLHENEKDIYGDIPERVLDILESIGSPWLRLAWDNANFVQVGVHPHRDGFAMLADYIDYFQIKDARFDTGAVTPAGEGDGELLATIVSLAERGYNGYASLEPHLAIAGASGGFSGPAAFGVAARAFRRLTDQVGVTLV